MFKLVVLSALVAIACARPGYVSHYDTPVLYDSAPVHHQEYVTIQEPTLTKVGAIVKSVPSAVSHQSSTVVHSKAHVVTPILAETVKTYHAPLVKTYSAAPIAEYAPIVNSYESEPIIHSASYDDYSPISYGYDADAHYHHLH